MKHMLALRRQKEGFALPTILVASVIMLILLSSAVLAVSSVTTAINSQYYNQLAREAAESGIARATDCLQQSSNYTPGWTASAPLTPATNCSGVVQAGQSAYVVQSSNVQTTFSIGAATTGTSNALHIVATGTVQLIQTSSAGSANGTSVWRTYTQSLAQDNHPQAAPQVGGGAGWQTSGHFGYMVSTAGQLYMYGDNSFGEITGAASPITVPVPYNVPLPNGVSSVVYAVSSGQGASFICIVGNDTHVYCRGGGTDAIGLVQPAIWQEVTDVAGNALTTSTTTNNLFINGYGTDGGCVISSTDTGSSGPQAYCFGINDYGTLGANSSSNVTLTNALLFDLPNGLSAATVMTHDVQTCVITTVGSLYCAGQNFYGQLAAAAGTTGGGSGQGGYWMTPQLYPLPANKLAASVITTYHNGGLALHVLATDGTIWSSGYAGNAELGSAATASTYVSQTPTEMYDPTYATGGTIKNGTLCIDDKGGIITPGNPIQVYTCNSTASQNWLVTNDGELLNYGSNMCIDVPANSNTSGTLIDLYTCNHTTAQQWVVNANGTITHVTPNGTTYCLDSGAGTSGTQLQQVACVTSKASQIFALSSYTAAWQGLIAQDAGFCAVRNDGTSGVYCAGDNTYGQLADGNCTLMTAGTAPDVQRMSLPAGQQVDTTKLNHNWQWQYQSLMVITKSGNIYGAGSNQYGKLGSGTVSTLSPNYQTCSTVQFQLPSGVQAMDMSTLDQYTTYVLGSDGNIYASGYNVNGQLGNGTVTSYSASPVVVQVPRQQTVY